MPFDVKIKNIGKLAEAEIRIDRFTVLAGPNNSGKSFVSKTLYSVIGALNEDFLRNYFVGLIAETSRRCSFAFIRRDANTYSNLHSNINNFLQGLEEYAINKRLTTTTDIEKTVSYFVQQIDEFLENIHTLVDEEESGDSSRALESNIDFITDTRDQIANHNAHEIFELAKSEEIKQKFISNFQVSQLSQIARDQTQSLIVDTDKFGRYEYSNGQFKSINSDLRTSNSHSFSTIIYLESPIYLKLMKALDYPAFLRRLRPGRSAPITGIPGYISELAEMLKFDYVGDVAFPDLYEKLTNDEVMGGRLTVSEDGAINFQENGCRFSLPITATGVANIGMLALLIERKILDKDSLLFVDEPEAHLHPGWQVLIAESLFELARHGMHVVIATHSADILKWLEVHVKKNPEDKEFVALNQFPVSSPSIFDNSEQHDFETKLADITQQLSRPFADLYVDGL